MTQKKSEKLLELMSTEEVMYSSSANQVPTDSKHSEISRKGQCNMGSNKVSSVACCIVGATTLVLKNSGVEKSVKRNLPNDESTINVLGMTFADVAIAQKRTNVNFKSRVPKTKVPSVPIMVPSLEDFPPHQVHLPKFNAYLWRQH